jgi:peroxiredoxin
MPDESKAAHLLAMAAHGSRGMILFDFLMARTAIQCGMNSTRCLPLLLIMACAPTAVASPSEAARILKAWESGMEKWVLETSATTSPDARAAAIAKQPDATKTVREIWLQISPALDQEWVLEYAAWFLRVAPEVFSAGADGTRVQVFSNELFTLLKALGDHHTTSKGMAQVCMALASVGDPRALSLLEKILNSHPDTKTQGVAALAAAMVLRSLGDDPELMRKRLTYLRKSIIDSSEIQTVPGITVAQIAEDELYIIRHLSKGRVAPDIQGVDSAGRPLKLSDHTGKIIVLVFWSSTMSEAGHTIQLVNELTNRFRDRPVLVLGVNHDPLEKLRELEGGSVVSWRSFSDPEKRLSQAYRIGSWPQAHVLDGELRIQYTGVPGSFTELTVEALLSEAQSTDSE